MPMTGFVLQTSGVGSDCYTNWATTTAPAQKYISNKVIAIPEWCYKIVPHLELTHIVILVCPIGLLGKVLASKSKVSHPIALPIKP